MFVLYYNHDCIPSSFCKLGNLKAYFKYLLFTVV